MWFSIPFPRAGARCSIRRLDSLVEKLWQCIPIDQNQQTKEIPGFQEISFDISTYVNAVEGKVSYRLLTLLQVVCLCVGVSLCWLV